MDAESSEQKLTNALPIKGDWEPKIPHETITIITGIIARQDSTFKMLPNGIECGHAIAMWLGSDTPQGPFMELLRRTNSLSKFNRIMSDYRRRGATKDEEQAGAIYRICEFETKVLTYDPVHPLVNPDELDKERLQSAINHGFVSETYVEIYNLLFLPLSPEMPIILAAIGNSDQGTNIRDLMLESLYLQSQ